MSSSSAARIRRIAENQNGVVTSGQAIQAGLSRSTLKRRVKSGAWQRIERGVYLVYGSFSVLTHLQAAVIALPAVISHQSAAQFHGFGWDILKDAVVTVPHRRTNRFGDVVVHESTDLDPQHVTRINGLPVTTPERTLFDLASIAELAWLRPVVERALVQRRVTIEGLEAILSELGRPGRPGTTQFRRLMEDLSPGYVAAESVLEEKMIALLAKANLPTPTRQLPLPWRDQADGRVDFAYEAARLIIECDGRRWHTTAEAFEKDRRRDNLAQLNGWRVLRFTWTDLTKAPTEVVTQISQALAGAYAA